MERTKIEQLFENYSFWRHLSEEEKKMLQEQIRWCMLLTRVLDFNELKTPRLKQIFHRFCLLRISLRAFIVGFNFSCTGLYKYSSSLAGMGNILSKTDISER